jgi:hypothetical protein
LLLRAFGVGILYLNDEAQKFEPRGRLGAFIGYGPRKSVEVLDVAAFQRGVIKIVTTRDIRDFPRIVFPFKDLEIERGRGWHFDIIIDRQLRKTCRHVITQAPITCPECLAKPAETDLMVKGKVFAHHKKYKNLEFGHANDDSCRLIRCFCTRDANELPDDRAIPFHDDEEELDDNTMLADLITTGRAEAALDPVDAVDWADELSSISEVPSLPGAAAAVSLDATSYHGYAFTVTREMEANLLDDSYIRGFCLVYKSMNPNDKLVIESSEAQAAIDKEIGKMIKYFVFGDLDTDVREWSDVCKENADATAVPMHLLIGIKDSELPEALWMWKARLVAAGNRHFHYDGSIVVEDDMYAQPADLESVRIVAAHATIEEDGDLLSADAENAYLQADW